MRQHPLMIRWCITKYYLSASPYNQLFCNKLSSLKPLSGFNPDILNKLMRVKIRFMALFLFFLSVTLCFDESRLNQIQFTVIRQIGCQDLQKWGTLMMSFVNFKTLWKVKIQATIQEENSLAMFWFISIEGNLAFFATLLHILLPLASQQHNYILVH